MAKKPNLSELTLIDALRDSRLIGDSVSEAQETALRALYGLPLSASQFAIYQRATGRDTYVPREYREAGLYCGRRSGKSSKLAANCAVFEAAFRPHELARGERGHVVVIAPTRKQAGVVFDYILSRLEESPTLRRMIDGDPRADEVDLTNGITIAVWPCSFRSIRGISIVCAICDEIAFWRDDLTGANPASEVLRAIRPAMSTFRNAKLIKISSPWAKTGVVWDDWNGRAAYPEMLVWKLDSATMNPSLDADFLAAEQKRDPESFAREYGAEFYEAASALLPADAVDACVSRGRYELPPQPNVFYTFSLDAAFKSDEFGFAGVHRSPEGRVIVDLVRSWKPSRSRPVQLAEVLGEIVATMRAYHASKIYGDQVAAEPIRQALREQGITFEQCTTLGRRAAAIFATLRSLVISGQIEFPDDSETISQLKKLELLTTGGGGQRVEASSGHDDRAICLALAVHQASSQPIWDGQIPPIEFEPFDHTGPPLPLSQDKISKLPLSDPGPDFLWH